MPRRAEMPGGNVIAQNLECQRLECWNFQRRNHNPFVEEPADDVQFDISQSHQRMNRCRSVTSCKNFQLRGGEVNGVAAVDEDETMADQDAAWI